MTTLIVAVTQPVMTADPVVNGDKACELMRRAAQRGARLVHFPEGFVSGYAKEQHPDWEGVDWAEVRRQVRRIADLARDLRLWVVLGSAHPLTPPNPPHNSLYVISDRGEIADRYDKRLCSYTEITRFYSPGFEPVVFEVDGYVFGCLLCIEVNFPDLFAEYERLGVDCLLLSAYPVDSILKTKAQALAAINNYWLSLSVPQQSRPLMSSGLAAPDGRWPAQTEPGEDLVIHQLDRDDPELHIPLNLARPWRARAREGSIFRDRRVTDDRSDDRTCL